MDPNFLMVGQVFRFSPCCRPQAVFPRSRYPRPDRVLLLVITAVRGGDMDGLVLVISRDTLAILR